jgi:hypothetical protein
MAQQSPPGAQMYEAEWQLDGKGVVRLYIQAANEADVLTEAEDFFTRLLAHIPGSAPAGDDAKAAESGDAPDERADIEQAQPYEQTARANEQVTPSASNPKATESANGLIEPAEERPARETEQISKPEPDGAQDSSPVSGRRLAVGRPALRGLIGLLFAASIFVAAFVSQSSHIDPAKLTVVRWAAQLGSTSSEPLDQSERRVPRDVSAAQRKAAESMASQPMPSPQSAPQDVAADQAQMLQVITRDLAKLGQRIEELDTRQQRMAGDNAKAIEHLTASQDQLARENIMAIQQLGRTQ